MLYTNVIIISTLITCIYRKLTINYSKFHMKNYQACLFYEDLANTRDFLLWHARWERRLPPLPKKKTWPSMSSIPPPLLPHQICCEKFLAILIRKPPLPTVDLCVKALDFLHFQIISNYTIKGWNNLTCYKDEIMFVENFISPGTLFHISKYYFGRYSSELAKLVPFPYSHRKPYPYSERLPDFPVTIPGCYKDDHVNSFFLLHLDSAILYLQNVFL